MRIECFKYKNLTMKIRFSYFAFALLGLVACNNTPSEIAVDEEALANTQMAEAQREKGREGNPFDNANNNNFAMPTASAGGAQGVMLNPPHGEPGHRCDIPVGAPLNSKPAAQPAAAQPQVTQQQIVIDPQQAQQHTGTTEPGFSGKPNPPHGQPGHRCDIAVGAILP